MVTREKGGFVMVVEDPFIRNYVRTVLARSGYTIVEAEPHRALDLLQSEGSKVQVVVTNKPSPFVPFRTELAMVYIASVPDPEIAAQFPSCRILQKPFQAQELANAVNELTGSL
jgi:hypothetical protein